MRDTRRPSDGGCRLRALHFSACHARTHYLRFNKSIQCLTRATRTNFVSAALLSVATTTVATEFHQHRQDLSIEIACQLIVVLLGNRFVLVVMALCAIEVHAEKWTRHHTKHYRRRRSVRGTRNSCRSGSVVSASRSSQSKLLRTACRLRPVAEQSLSCGSTG